MVAIGARRSDVVAITAAMLHPTGLAQFAAAFPDRVYDVECLFPDRKVPIPLGDLETATPICNACVAPHIFRPDED